MRDGASRPRSPAQRKQMIRFLFALFGVILTIAVIHWMTRPDPTVIEIPVPSNRPRAVARPPVETATAASRVLK